MILQQTERCEASYRQRRETRRGWNWRSVQHVLPPVAPATHVAVDAERMEADTQKAEKGGEFHPDPGERAIAAGGPQRRIQQQRTTDRWNGNRRKHCRIVVGAAEMQQSGF